MKNYIEEFMKDHGLEVNQEFEIIPSEDYYIPIIGRFTDIFTLETRYMSDNKEKFEENDEQLFLMLRDDDYELIKLKTKGNKNEL